MRHPHQRGEILRDQKRSKLTSGTAAADVVFFYFFIYCYDKEQVLAEPHDSN